MFSEEIQSFLKALSNENRQKIMLLFMNRKELTVGEVATLAEIGQSTASEHLLLLKRAGLMDSRKEGKEVIYYPNKDKIVDFLEELATYLRSCC